MKLLRKIKTAVTIFAFTVVAWSLFYLTASAADCIWVCPKPYICYLVCF